MSAGQAIGTIGGAIIGFFTGGPAGAVKGAYWGYMAGSVIDPPPGPHTEGPRLNDRVVQTSEEGAPMPTVFGTVRIAGNVIWSTGLEEIATTEEQGGGSGGGGATSTTYSYITDAAIALCAGEIVGVRRIWADAKLIYDVSDAVSVGSLIASNTRAAGIRVYPGSEAQEPDPLIQAIEGATNTPAFRGIAYAVFEDLQLADFGNRLPNFSFEVVVNSAYVDAQTDYNAPTSLTNTYSMRAPLYDYDGLHLVDCADGIWAHYLLIPGEQKATLVESRTVSASTLPYFYPSTHDTCDEVGKFMTMAISSGLINYQGYENNVFVDRQWNTSTIGNIVSTGACKRGVDYLFAGIDSTSGYKLGVIFNGLKLTSVPSVDNYGAKNTCYIGNESLLVYHDFYVYRFDLAGNYLDSFALGSGIYVTNFISDDQFFMINGAGDIALATITGSSTFTSVDVFDCPNLASGSPSNTIAVVYSLRNTDDGNFIGFISANSGIQNVTVKTKRLSKGITTLDAVCEAIAEQSDLASSDYDFTALSADSVRGYVVGRPMSGRAALEPLQTAYHFDLAERDGKIYAIKRGGSIVATIPEDDLGAAENPDGIKVKLTRHNETELPSEIQISYSDIDNDHQAGTQYARSLTAQTTNIQQISLPLGMTSQEAAQLAEVILNSARYTGRHTLEFALSYEYARLAPADVVSLPAYGVQWSARIGQIDMGMPGLVQCQASPEVAALYASILSGADATGIGQTLGLTGTTTLNLLDCALLRDDDNSLGWYVALSGSVDTWPGGALYKSNDAGATWTYAASAARMQAARIGTATNALANADCRVWDKTNTISVHMQADATLSSTTEANLLAGANSALIGESGSWELIQFLTATIETDGSHTLRDLLRGRKGTEHAAASHAIGDRFILLETSTLQNMPAPSVELNAARDYKSLTLGQALESVSSVSYTYTGERLRCLAPVELGGGRDASGNLTINWKRRDRINSGWNNYADIPMSESSEAYEIELYTSSAYTTLKRTITGLTSATASYTSAQQVTDYGSNQATVYARVYQLSATTGRGHFLQGSI